VEADECYQSAGSKGLPREVERTTANLDNEGFSFAVELPPRRPSTHSGLVQRATRQTRTRQPRKVYLEVLENVRTRRSTSYRRQVKSGSQFFTDEYNSTISRRPTMTIVRSTMVRASMLVVTRDGACVHCNTMEGIWSGLRNFLDRFKGISQRFLHLRVGRLRIPAQPWALALVSDLRSSLAVLFSTPGDYLRRMAHQHRRMPLTLCYR